jgi:GH3 auxin-responsive promoter
MRKNSPALTLFCQNSPLDMARLLENLLPNTSPIRRIKRAMAHTPTGRQQLQLEALLHRARGTQFGRHYDFSGLLRQFDASTAFQSRVPAVDYNTMYERWWSLAHQCDSPDVCWPGLVPYYALSSGTSQAATKYIPLTPDMLRHMKRSARRMLYTATRMGVPPTKYTRQMLMVGSCTQPRPEGRHLTGDLSGIMGLHRPLWMDRLYRPGRHISDLPDWHQRIEYIADEAPRWDIGSAVSNPMWLQLLLERIVEKYQLDHIHQLWPNFSLYVHGGVFFEPYRPAFEQLLGKKIQYIDSYAASEGVFGWQRRPHDRAMRLVTDGGIFFEFVPFDQHNFDDEGNLRSEYPDTCLLHEVQPHRDYALLLSTCAGAWRYLLGDTIRFTDVANAEFVLRGRTKQYLSVCGEHLSIDNLNEAIRRADAQLGVGIREFAVAGVRHGTKWAHQWYVSCQRPDVAPAQLLRAIDAALAELNEDYALERLYALDDVRLRVLPNSTFVGWLEQRGKLNGQAKIPRVLKGAQLTDFEDWVAAKS